jgi:hypothetical protein
MSPVTTNTISRSLQALTLGQVMEEGRQAMKAGMGLTEFDQQFQVPISGAATERIAWESLDIRFEWAFLDARRQRGVSLAEPQFTFGAVVPKGGPVVVTAVVQSWNRSADAFRGATVLIGVFAPASAEEVTFQGQAHLTFQGFGAPPIMEA